MEPCAVVSDIHGNRWALEAVLADLRRRGAGRLLNLGDIFYGPLDPAGTLRLLRELELPATSIRGNQDRIVFAASAADEAESPSLPFTRAQLGADGIAWLRALPAEAVALGCIRLCHGTPASDEVYLLEEVTAAGVCLRPRREIERDVGGTEPVLVCGHSHIPRAVHLGSGTLVVNPGSVGLPAYADVHPHPHRMETGSPCARYALLHQGPRGWQVEHVSLPYDFEAAASAAEGNGRPDWAIALRTGYAT